MNWLRKIIPKRLLSFYHLALAHLAVLYYKNPSNELIVIGVTGTTGKSSTCLILSKLMEAKGKTGLVSTAMFKIGEKEWINDTKMTMLGRFQLQKMLRQMVDAGCRYAIIESSSQGVEQFRHIGINYDYLIFTNLSPEHIEAHGGFENYKKAKGKLFEHLTAQPKKSIQGKVIEKKIVANLDDGESAYFLSFPADKKIGYTMQDRHAASVDAIYNITDIMIDDGKTEFKFEEENFTTSLLGQRNVYNISAALSVAFEENLERVALKKICEKLILPGRLEFIEKGQDFKVIVDYAFEPKAMNTLYQTLKLIPHQKVIHVLGGTGGGRDQARRPIIGEIAGKNSDFVIITDEDPYDENPKQIMDQVASGAIGAGKTLGENLIIIEDRKEAIKYAIMEAKAGDLVLITGKGSEQCIVTKGGKKIAHDDREVARGAITTKKRKNEKSIL